MVHNLGNLDAIHNLALEPSDLIRAPQNRAGVLWSPSSTLLFHFSFGNLIMAMLIVWDHYQQMLAPGSIIRKFLGNNCWNCQTVSLGIEL